MARCLIAVIGVLRRVRFVGKVRRRATMARSARPNRVAGATPPRSGCLSSRTVCRAGLLVGAARALACSCPVAFFDHRNETATPRRPYIMMSPTMPDRESGDASESSTAGRNFGVPAASNTSNPWPVRDASRGVDPTWQRGDQRVTQPYPGQARLAHPVLAPHKSRRRSLRVNPPTPAHDAAARPQNRGREHATQAPRGVPRCGPSRTSQARRALSE